MKLSKSITFAAAPLFQVLTFSNLATTTTSALVSNISMTSGSRSQSSQKQQQQCNKATPALDKARGLQLPSREEILRRDPKVYDFWNDNDALVEEAWKEWETTSGSNNKALPKLDESLIHPKLRTVVDSIWKSVQAGDFEKVAAQDLILKELDLWEEVAPGVYSVQFLDLGEIHKLRQWFDAAAESGIPIRPPYGIVLNRKGFMIDPRSVGYWAAPGFQAFYKDILIDSYIRPISRLFFPDSIVATDDSESFAFSIQYQVGGDESIRHHTDASTVTFNINLDSEQVWTGSSLYFWESLNDGGGETRRYTVDWAPGKGIMHLGRTLHAALPIESGIRNNIVVWTMGKDGGRGYGGPPLMTTEDGKYHEDYQLTREERWTKPDGPAAEKPWDRWSPF